MQKREEVERPVEWLRRLDEDDGYAELVEDSGSLAVAAYRLALARRKTAARGGGMPTVRELSVAAALIAARIPGLNASSAEQLASDCEHSGCRLLADIAGAPARTRRAS
jgi:hypothetical protein